MIFYSSLGILIVVWGASLWGRFFDEELRNTNLVRIYEYLITKFSFSLSIFLISLSLFYQGFEQYESWGKSEISKFLLPPYQSWTYFIFYIGWRIIAPYLISFGAGILFFFIARGLNQKYEERFFYPEELYFGAISLFLTSHPGWLFYSVLIIIIYLAIHLISFLISHYSLQRLSLYYLWMPTAIFVILIQGWLTKLSLWSLLKI